MEARGHDLVTSAGLLILRLGIGGYLLTHGVGKLQRLIDGEPFSDPIGLGPTASLVLIAFAEFFCTILVMIGLATRVAAVPIVFAMAVAAFVAHANDPWTAAEGARLFRDGEATSWASRQPALMFLVVVLSLIFTGAGRFSIDALIRWRPWRRTGSPR
jgi:putative oxidoreductase